MQFAKFCFSPKNISDDLQISNDVCPNIATFANSFYNFSTPAQRLALWRSARTKVTYVYVGTSKVIVICGLSKVAIAMNVLLSIQSILSAFRVYNIQKSLSLNDIDIAESICGCFLKFSKKIIIFNNKNID